MQIPEADEGPFGACPPALASHLMGAAVWGALASHSTLPLPASALFGTVDHACEIGG